jgi:hypothetical protein
MLKSKILGKYNEFYLDKQISTNSLIIVLRLFGVNSV